MTSFVTDRQKGRNIMRLEISISYLKQLFKCYVNRIIIN
jgi:hypothetical protein